MSLRPQGSVRPRSILRRSGRDGALSSPASVADAGRILDHLELPSTPPLLTESRFSATEVLFSDAPAYDEIGVEPLAWSEPLDTGPPDARDPP